ncbi:MAG: hypothetical protein D6731_17460, partial [Planctomycetota bacterium]
TGQTLEEPLEVPSPEGEGGGGAAEGAARAGRTLEESLEAPSAAGEAARAEPAPPVEASEAGPSRAKARDRAPDASEAIAEKGPVGRGKIQRVREALRGPAVSPPPSDAPAAQAFASQRSSSAEGGREPSGREENSAPHGLENLGVRASGEDRAKPAAPPSAPSKGEDPLDACVSAVARRVSAPSPGGRAETRPQEGLGSEAALDSLVDAALASPKGPSPSPAAVAPATDDLGQLIDRVDAAATRSLAAEEDAVVEHSPGAVSFSSRRLPRPAPAASGRPVPRSASPTPAGDPEGLTAMIHKTVDRVAAERVPSVRGVRRTPRRLVEDGAGWVLVLAGSFLLAGFVFFLAPLGERERPGSPETAAASSKEPAARTFGWRTNFGSEVPPPEESDAGDSRTGLYRIWIGRRDAAKDERARWCDAAFVFRGDTLEVLPRRRGVQLYSVSAQIDPRGVLRVVLARTGTWVFGDGANARSEAGIETWRLSGRAAGSAGFRGSAEIVRTSADGRRTSQVLPFVALRLGNLGPLPRPSREDENRSVANRRVAAEQRLLSLQRRHAESPDSARERSSEIDRLKGTLATLAAEDPEEESAWKAAATGPETLEDALEAAEVGEAFAEALAGLEDDSESEPDAASTEEETPAEIRPLSDEEGEDLLLSLLDREDVDLRTESLEVLGALGREDSVEEIARLFADPEPDVRRQAVRSLVTIARRRPLPGLNRRLLSLIDAAAAGDASDLSLRRAEAALEAFARLQGRTGLPKLRSLLDEHGPLRRAALRLLVREEVFEEAHRRADLTASLVVLWRDPASDRSLRTLALQALRRWGTPDCVDPLLESATGEEALLLSVLDAVTGAEESSLVGFRRYWEGARRVWDRYEELAGRLEEVLDGGDAGAPALAALEALRVLRLPRIGALAADCLQELLEREDFSREAEAFSVAACRLLANHRRREAAPVLIEALRSRRVSAPVREAAHWALSTLAGKPGPPNVGYWRRAFGIDPDEEGDE